MQAENENKKEGFHFTYSAQEQEEVRKIRQKYQPQEESKIDKLRRLDAKVTQKASKVSLIIGILGALIMGIGMSLSMTELWEQLGFESTTGMILGIVIGTAGILLICLAYPTYAYVLKKEREKIAPEVLKLTEELMVSK